MTILESFWDKIVNVLANYQGVLDLKDILKRFGYLLYSFGFRVERGVNYTGFLHKRHVSLLFRI